MSRLKLILPALIFLIGAALYGFGASFGPRIGPGWSDLLECFAGFVMLGGGIWMIARVVRIVGKAQ